MIVTRAVARPSAWTFTIPPIKELVDRYVGDGKGWCDPFAGKNSPAEYTNDHNPDMPSLWHMDAEEFCKHAAAGSLSWEESGRMRYNTHPFFGVLFDPPYSYRQISEHYKTLGMKATQLDTSSNFYNRVKNAICDAIIPGGYAISCGWNSGGFGVNRGFEMIEVLLVNHSRGGTNAQDTIVTVEVKK